MTRPRIKALKEEVNKNGFMYKLVKRNEDRAIYSQHTALGQTCAYEVFKIKKGKLHPKSSEEDLKNYDLSERFPRDEDFGKTAWTYPSLKKAEQAYIGK